MKKWLRSGMVWACIGYIITMILLPLAGHEHFSPVKIILGIPLWIVVGMCLGFVLGNKKKTGTAKRKK